MVHHLHWVADPAAYARALADCRFDVILCDYLLPYFDGLKALALAREHCAETPFIFISGVVGEDFATDALKRGATDYILKNALVRLPGAVQRAIAEARERSERRRVEAALKASEISTRIAVEAAQFGTWNYVPDTRALSWDSRSRALFGVDEEGELTYDHLYNAIHPEDRERMHGVLHAAIAGDTNGEIAGEFRAIAPDGRMRWLSKRGRCFFENGRCTHCVGVLQDITAQKNAGEALRRLNESLEASVEARTRERDRAWRLSRDLLGVANSQGMLESVNPAWTATLGWTNEELRAAPHLTFVHPNDRAESLAKTASLSGMNSTTRFENRYRHRKGFYRWIAWTAVFESDLIYYVGRDITEERAAVEELAAANRQLQSQIEERERVEATLQQMQRLEAVGQLTSGVAHDFNNLLTVVLSNLSLLERKAINTDGALDAQTRGRLARMRDAAERGAKLTAQLLSFSPAAATGPPGTQPE